MLPPTTVQQFCRSVVRFAPFVGLVEMVDRLLQAEKEYQAPGQNTESDVEAVDPEPPFLNQEDQVQAEAMLASILQPCRLTEVLAEMAAQGLMPKVQDLVVT